MNPLTLPMMGKANPPMLTTVLLVVLGVLIGAVIYLIIIHRLGARAAKKRGDSSHTGHHGNH